MSVQRPDLFASPDPTWRSHAHSPRGLARDGRSTSA
jgi:hypothetical protein